MCYRIFKINRKIFFYIIITTGFLSLFSCSNDNNIYLEKSDHKLVDLVRENEVMLTDLFVIGEGDCLGCLELSREGDEFTFEGPYAVSLSPLILSLTIEGENDITLTLEDN